MEFKLNYMGFVALFGILLGLVGFFLIWVDHGGSTDSGLDHLLSMNGKYAVNAMLLFAGMIVTLMLLALEFTGSGAQSSKFMLMAVGLVMIISSMTALIDADRYAGAGLILEVAASIIIFVSALFMFFGWLEPKKA
ncbi:MAG: hypothetical protein FWD37_03060 [Methanomassiliicoccaceae archaeon]|nr:hypothetical protein [Methanomassiliicoccaceae archaeon]